MHQIHNTTTSQSLQSYFNHPFNGLQGITPIPSCKQGSINSHSVLLQSKLYWGCNNDENKIKEWTKLSGYTLLLHIKKKYPG